MTKLRSGDPWMPAPAYGHSLEGLTVNLLVADIDAALPFQTEVLGAAIVYRDPDIAVLRFESAEWLLHAFHTYDHHPLYATVSGDAPKGVGVELRVHGRDPDAAEACARRLGYEVVAAAENKAHGLRESVIRDQDGYFWVPDVPVAEDSA
jgi:catechol 2,3-dioxygenase-like lactoylglutathione lyase family enzyme